MTRGTREKEEEVGITVPLGEETLRPPPATPTRTKTLWP